MARTWFWRCEEGRVEHALNPFIGECSCFARQSALRDSATWAAAASAAACAVRQLGCVARVAVLGARSRHDDDQTSDESRRNESKDEHNETTHCFYTPNSHCTRSPHCYCVCNMTTSGNYK